MIIETPITVIMTVYNSELYLQDSIESIIKQTYKNFKFIIINDGSTDGSEEIIKNFKDNRIIYINNILNIGVAKSLNKGLLMSKSPYIVRMDADDIAVKDRLQSQLDYMEKHKDIGVLGGQVVHFNEIEKIIKYKEESPTRINSLLLFSNPIMHPTVMIRREVLDNNNIMYNKSFVASQDYSLWIDLYRRTKIKNMDKILLYYRMSDNSMTKSYESTSISRHINLISTAFEGLKIKTTLVEVENYVTAIYKSRKDKTENVNFLALNETFRKIERCVSNNENTDLKIFKQMAGYIWLKNIVINKKLKNAFSIRTLQGIKYLIYLKHKKSIIIIKNVKRKIIK